MSVEHVFTTLVANSDDALAEVERAKMSGEPLKSVSANGAVVVPTEVAQAIVEDFSKQDTYVGRLGATYAAHLESYHEKIQDIDWVHATNEEKAAAHAAYSAELIRQRRAEEAEVLNKLAAGHDITAAIRAENERRAAEHEKALAEYELQRREREANAMPALAVIEETVKVLKTEDLIDKPFEDRVAAMTNVVPVPDASEAATKQALETKDAIIETAIPFEEKAADNAVLRAHDRPAVNVLDEHKVDDSPEGKSAQNSAKTDVSKEKSVVEGAELEGAINEANDTDVVVKDEKVKDDDEEVVG